jgi:hypothetical protein
MARRTRVTRGTALLHELRKRARRQAGVFTVQQAEAVGLSHAAVQAQVDAGRCSRIHRGVYLLGNMQPARQALEWAAVLAAGPGARISHESAAFNYGYVKRRPALIDVTVPAPRTCRPLTGVRIRRSRLLAELPEHPSRLPITSPSDTVLDLIAGFRSPHDVVALLTDAIRTRRVTASAILDAMGARPRLRHRQLVRDVLNDVMAGVDSVLEYRYLVRVERPHGLPIGKRQVSRTLKGTTIAEDVEYEEYEAVVELDGRLGHEGSGQHRDRRRDNANTVQRRATLRYGHADLCNPCEVAVEVAAVLRGRGWTGTPRACGPRCPVR